MTNDGLSRSRLWFRRAGIFRHSFLIAFLLLGCYELPPEMATGGTDPSLPSGWPPRAIYHEDPFHPVNLFFQRMFIAGGVSGDGVAEDVGAGEVLVFPRGPFEPLDRAELETYSERIIRIVANPDLSIDALSPRGAAMLVRDVAVERDRLNDRRAPGDEEVAATFNRLTRAIEESWTQSLPALPPPPSGALTAMTLTRLSPHDRLRPLHGGLEAWTTEGTYHFHRTRWLRGEDPWRKSERPECGECHGP